MSRTRSRLVQLGIAASLVAANWMTFDSASAQQAIDTQLANGSLEAENEQGLPKGWFFSPMSSESGFLIAIEVVDPFEGERTVMIDSTSADTSNGTFGNFVQRLDATPWRGKTVRFRAAVRTAEQVGDATAQLWFRVDRKLPDGQSMIGAFDNMNDRPIRNEEWDYYEIVATIEEDAATIAVGLLVIGNGKAWIDDISFEEVDEETPTTASSPTASSSTASSGAASSGSAGTDSGQQSFWSPWLLLVVLTLFLFVVSQTKISESVGGYFQRFALRFSLAYWVLYSFPAPFAALIPYYGYRWAAPYQTLVDKVVRWTAANVLQIEQTLVGPNGSGDTTFDFVRLLVCFSLAAAIGILWSLVDWRKTDLRITNDLLRSYVRYVLAFTMLGYGLAKVGWAMNQFPAPGVDQLLRTYGDSSPMGLVWTFMGASRPYTIFAGLGEIAGALLLIWRRTTTLGAFVVFGVMLNVVMLNFCYDVPVKQYSSHLLGMAVFLLLPEIPRLTKLLVRNRGVDKVDLLPPYTGRVTVWIQRCVKVAIIVVGIGLPIGQKIQMELSYEPYDANQPEFFGSYIVEEFERNGEIVPPLLTDGSRWNHVTFRKIPRWQENGIVGVDYITFKMMDDSQFASELALSEDQNNVLLTNTIPSVPQNLRVNEVDEHHIIVESGEGENLITVKLRRLRREDFLLVNRGFRWINEYPYNR